MAEQRALREPWLVAAWPGLGGVAVIAAGYLAQTIRAERAERFSGEGYFDLHHIDVREGVMSVPRVPGGHFFEWRNPDGRGRDLILFLGEAQPVRAGDRMCDDVVSAVKERGVTRVLTFAALATQLEIGAPARVHAVASDRGVLGDALEAGAIPLEEGQVGGLNGLLLASARREGLEGLCLMAEMPYFAGGVPNPKAAHAALGVFARMSGVDLDLSDLAAEADALDAQLRELLRRMKSELGEDESIELGLGPDEPDPEPEPEPGAPEAVAAEAPGADEPPPPRLAYAERDRVERLFEEARKDRARAFELKRELDRLGVFGQYEDRFLDLFKRGQ
jgi:proteasome assembly chaperone (PAC2) family protein